MRSTFHQNRSASLPCPEPRRARSMREVLEALEWVRREMLRSGSPDFIRQKAAEGRVRELSAKLARGKGGA